MKTYTVSRLAEDAGVSVHMVRHCVLRGILRPVRRTQGGHCLFDEHSRTRLRFVRGALDSGIPLKELARLYRSLDAEESDEVEKCVESLMRRLTVGEAVMAAVKMELGRLSDRAAGNPLHA